MILKNIISTLTLFAVAAMGLVGAFNWQVTTAAAQTEQALYCPIESDLSATFLGLGAQEVTDEAQIDVRVTNSSSYILSSVRVALAAYQNETDATPAYWSVSDGEQQLDPGATITIGANFDLTTLPAGEYVIRAFAVQGDETDALGAVINGDENADILKVTKTTEQSNLVEVSVFVNETEFTGSTITVDNSQDLAVRIETTNNNERNSVKGNDMLGAIAHGEVPLGAAVQRDTLDGVGLIPGATRTTELRDRFVHGGTYTVFAGLVNPTALQPLVVVPVDAGEGYRGGEWPYISQVGLSDDRSEVVVCTSYVGAEAEGGEFQSPMAADLTFTDSAGQELVQRVNATIDGPKDHFTYSSEAGLADASLKVDLFYEGFLTASNIGDNEEDEGTTYNYIMADSIVLNFTCDESGECDQADVSAGVTGGQWEVVEVATKPSFWFYAGIVLVALLLMYLMLRRLGPEKPDESREVSLDELQ